MTWPSRSRRSSFGAASTRAASVTGDSALRLGRAPQPHRALGLHYRGRPVPARPAVRRPPAPAAASATPRPRWPRAMRARVAVRGAAPAAVGSDCASSPARAPAGARPGRGRCAGGGSSSVFSSAFAAAAFIASAGAITATLAPPRWLVSCTQSISARMRSTGMASTAPSTSPSSFIESGSTSRRSGCWPAIT